MRTILKFDTGADGFKKMIWVLAWSAVLLLVIGGYFLWTVYNEMQAL